MAGKAIFNCREDTHVNWMSRRRGSRHKGRRRKLCWLRDGSIAEDCSNLHTVEGIWKHFSELEMGAIQGGGKRYYNASGRGNLWIRLWDY